jgi:hypothetical protein
MSIVKSGKVHSHRWESGDPYLLDKAKAISEFCMRGMTDHEKRGYSYTRLIRTLAGIEDSNCLEREISASLAHQIGRQPRADGAFIPTRMYAVTGLDTFTSGRGGSMVATEVRDLIELLRSRLRVAQWGQQSWKDSPAIFPFLVKPPAVL